LRHSSRERGADIGLQVVDVKFDTEQLPSILNALTTDNGGNKLTLEVAVSTADIESPEYH
jgi:F0F1-type ATP synthase beta subunit